MVIRGGFIMTVQLVTNEKIAETSSKGNQEKWFDGTSGHWYKLDQFGYESLSEVLVSRLLERSNVESDFPFHFVRYKMERLHVHGRDRNGCSSRNFLLPDQSIITLSHLYKRVLDKPLVASLERLSSDKKRIAWLAAETAEITQLPDFPKYLTLLFEIDALFLNEDRHLNNIALLEQNGTYSYCPIFDNGAALLSNTQIYGMDVAPAAHIKSVRARPFNTTFNRQIITARNLFGPQLRIPKFSRRDIIAELEPLLAFYAERDRGIIADRVCTCILKRQKV